MKTPQWTAWLERSCSAAPGGYVRVFADEGVPMAALVTCLVAAQKAGHAAARGVPLGCLARLLRRSAKSPPPRAPRKPPARRCRAWASS
jgi:hypothetical protein